MARTKTPAATPAGEGPTKKGKDDMSTDKSQNVQDVFLNHIRKNKTPVTIFLVNGVMLQGQVAGFDQFSLILERAGQVQLVYKHAISTVQPDHPLDLGSAEAGDGDDL